jgi:hypothetical protein
LPSILTTTNQTAAIAFPSACTRLAIGRTRSCSLYLADWLQQCKRAEFWIGLSEEDEELDELLDRGGRNGRK